MFGLVRDKDGYIFAHASWSLALSGAAFLCRYDRVRKRLEEKEGVGKFLIAMQRRSGLSLRSAENTISATVLGVNRERPGLCNNGRIHWRSGMRDVEMVALISIRV